MPLTITSEDSLLGMAEAQEKGERVLFVGASCQINPQTVRIFTGRNNELASVFPGLTSGISKERPREPTFYLAMSSRYNGVGVLQVALQYPFLAPDPRIVVASLRVLESTAGDWSHTNIFSPDVIGSGKFNGTFQGMLSKVIVPITLWTEDYSL